jgi:hypothetical protein
VALAVWQDPPALEDPCTAIGRWGRLWLALGLTAIGATKPLVWQHSEALRICRGIRALRVPI